MIPQNGFVLDSFEPETLPTRTIFIDTDRNRFSGFVDDIAAMEQAVYLILNIERFFCDLLSINYGVEFVDLFGQPLDYCEAEIPRKITEALTQDDRIESVEDFAFERGFGYIHAMFTVNTFYGKLETQRRVAV